MWHPWKWSSILFCCLFITGCSQRNFTEEAIQRQITTTSVSATSSEISKTTTERTPISTESVAETNTGELVDLTILSSTMVYSEVFIKIPQPKRSILQLLFEMLLVVVRKVLNLSCMESIIIHRITQNQNRRLPQKEHLAPIQMIPAPIFSCKMRCWNEILMYSKKPLSFQTLFEKSRQLCYFNKIIIEVR